MYMTYDIMTDEAYLQQMLTAFDLFYNKSLLCQSSFVAAVFRLHNTCCKGWQNSRR